MEPNEATKKRLIESGAYTKEDFLPEEGTCPYSEDINGKTVECDCSRYSRKQCRNDI